MAYKNENCTRPIALSLRLSMQNMLMIGHSIGQAGNFKFDVAKSGQAGFPGYMTVYIA